ncbi:metallophosphoesterase [Thermoplasma volcanium]|nr:metallophosphoesterase [Thermoplasma volcanium]
MRDIEILRDVFLSDLYCVYLRDISAVVVSDLHLGYEEEMNLHGLFLPRMQRDHVTHIMDKIVERYDPEKIIINGDFKQEFSKNLPSEWDDIIYFINRYDDRDLIFVRGNHDNYLATILSKKNKELLDYYEDDRYFIYHGDKDLSTKKITILGHEHPSLVLRDRVGGIYKLPAFAFNFKKNVIITPAMSFFSSGTDLSQSLLSEEHFTPSLKGMKASSFRIFAITDEFGLVDFGYLEDLRSSEGQQTRYR